ncbi:hypothetical protein [Extibacter muris]|uniref:hypothetical protein n=1 Tax=Extibacter muris TaxID=1796622 RepID=UPI001FAA4B26|nr:hypothetical protein [Extibacter muris]MCU0078285.1 hypothetical protein [Extibacter muris]
MLAEPYLSSTQVDTVVCLDGMETVGAFLAEVLMEPGSISVNGGSNISVVAPEQNQLGQMMFRDNTKRMIRRPFPGRNRLHINERQQKNSH